VHLWVTFARAVLAGAGRSNQGGIHQRVGLEHQTAIDQLGVERSQNLRAQVVLLEDMPEAKDNALIGQLGNAFIQLCKLTVE